MICAALCHSLQSHFSLHIGFEAPQSEVEFLRRRLAEEQANSQRANIARLEAETRCHIAERERDVYRLLARRWQSRLNSVLNQREEDNLSESESYEEATSSILLNGRDQVAIFGLGGLFRRFRTRATALESSDDDDEGNEDGDIEDASEHNGVSHMEEDEDDMNEDITNEEDSISFGSSNNGVVLVGNGSEALDLSVSPETVKAITSRPQARTVSISGTDP